MPTIFIIILVILLLGGGLGWHQGYYNHFPGGQVGYGGGLGTMVIILLVLWFFGVIG
jgi:hypothetical protein